MSKKTIILIIVLIALCVIGGAFGGGFAVAAAQNDEAVRNAGAAYKVQFNEQIYEINQRIEAITGGNFEDFLSDVEELFTATEGQIAELSGKYAAALQTIKSNLEELQTLRGGELEAYQDQLTQINADMADIEGTDPGYEQALAVVNLAISSTQSAIDALTEQIAAIDDLMDALGVPAEA